MILVANKVDLMHLRKITRDQGKEMATKYNVGDMRASERVCVRACVLCVWASGLCVKAHMPSLLQCWSLEIGPRPPTETPQGGHRVQC